MRTILALILMAFATTGAFAQTTHPGDVNGDGQVSIEDSNLIRDHILGRIELTAEQLQRGDTNGDGVPDISDLIAFAHHYTVATPSPTPSPVPTTALPTISPRPSPSPTASPVPTASPTASPSPSPTATPAPTAAPVMVLGYRVYGVSEITHPTGTKIVMVDQEQMLIQWPGTIIDRRNRATVPFANHDKSFYEDCKGEFYTLDDFHDRAIPQGWSLGRSYVRPGGDKLYKLTIQQVD